MLVLVFVLLMLIGAGTGADAAENGVVEDDDVIPKGEGPMS